jgi:hypothetical protein
MRKGIGSSTGQWNVCRPDTRRDLPPPHASADQHRDGAAVLSRTTLIAASDDGAIAPEGRNDDSALIYSFGDEALANRCGPRFR